jgi:hypothetical protein
MIPFINTHDREPLHLLKIWPGKMDAFITSGLMALFYHTEFGLKRLRDVCIKFLNLAP